MKYLIESPHTKEECLREMDEVLAKGRDTLNKFYWGCSKGDHTGYAIVDARNEDEARNIIPSFTREKAKVVEIAQFSPDQIRSFHH